MRDDESQHRFSFQFNWIHFFPSSFCWYTKLSGKLPTDSKAGGGDNGSNAIIDRKEEGADGGVGWSPETHGAAVVSKLQAGYRIFVLSDQKFYKATVKKVNVSSGGKKNSVKVHYDGKKGHVFHLISSEKIMIVEQPKITECIRNNDPTKIDEFGLVEVSAQSFLPNV